MTFTISHTAAPDRDFSNWQGNAGAGSETYRLIHLASGNVRPVSADTVFGISGNNLPVSQNTTPWAVSGTSTIGSQAGLFVCLVALQSGTSNYIPLQCNEFGMLLTSGQ
jgi:hypothetical protein